jgi:threonine/homoserine/homoserine lactone efflux protein
MELWIPFVVASIIILIIPGPTIILVISQAVSHGRRSVVPLVAGVLLGDFTAMSLSLLGLGAVLSASSALFNTFKWVGVIYLLFLGIKLWRLNLDTVPPHYNTQKTSTGSLLRRSFIVTALNPKSIAFFVAFLPQFVNPLQPALPQMLLLGGTFLLLATINATLYALFAGQLSEQIKKPNVRKWIDRCGGSALIGAGIFTAGMQKAA